MADGRIIIDTEVNSNRAEKEVSGLGSKLSGIAKTGVKAFTGAVATTSTALGALGTIGVKYNSSMEQYMASFTTMLGSADKASKHMEELKSFAAKTPFEMADLAQASTTLLAFGVNVNEIMPDLKMLGDISLGNREKFNGLALVFGQVKSQGKLMGQDLMQMINQGFNPLQVISEKTGKSMSQLKDEMSKGQITYEMVADAMKTATSAGGQFHNAMETQSKTLAGQWSTLKDNVNSLLGEAFLPLSDILKNKVLPAVNNVVDKLSKSLASGELKDSINNLAQGFGDLVVKLSELTVNWLPKIIDGFAWIINNAKNIIPIIASIITFMKGVETALAIVSIINKVKELGGVINILKMGLAAIGGSIGLVVIAVAAVVAGLVTLWNTNEGFRNTVIGAWNAILAAGQAVWGWLVNFFTVDIPVAWQSVIDFFASIPEWFANLWLTIQQAFVDGWNAIVNFFTVTIPTWINQIFNWFNELPYLIGYALGYALATIIKWGVDTWNYLVTNVPIWINNVVNFFSQLPGKIWTWLLNTINRIVAWGQQTYTNMVNAANNAINAVIQWFATLPGRIWTWLVNTISRVAQFAGNLASTARSAGANMVSNIIGAVRNLPSQFLNIGRNIVQGVWNGITGMGGWIRDRVNGFFSGIVDGAKAALGIHSPSRVFRDQVGKYMAQGVGVGFENETENIKSSMEKDLSQLVSKMQMTVDHEVATTTAGVVASRNALTSSTVTNNNDNGLNVNIENFNNTKSQDIQSLMEELEFYRKQNSLAKGGI